MKKKLLLILLVGLFQSGFTQNLIRDGSFEDTLNMWNMTTAARALSEALPSWFDAVNGFGGYFNIELGKQNLIYGSSVNGIPTNGVPDNTWARGRWPRTGIGYAGILLYVCRIFGEDSCRQTVVIYTPLKNNLIKEECYKIRIHIGATFYRSSFMTNAFDFKLDSIPLGFNEWPLDDTSITQRYCRCSFTLDTNDTETHYPDISTSIDAPFFDDTIGWQEFEFEYIAKGYEKFIHFGLIRGNICSNDSVPVISMPTTIGQFNNTSYLGTFVFLEDISVYPCDAPEYPAHIGIQDTCINKGMPIALGGVHQDEYLYWWYNANDSLISRQSSITVYPTESTSYVLVQKDFKFDETRDTVHIKVGDCLPLPPDYSHYDFSIYPNPNQGDFQVRFNTAVPEGAVLELYDLLGRKIAKYSLTGSQNIANISGVDVAPAIYYATVIVPNVFSKSVKMVVMR